MMKCFYIDRQGTIRNDGIQEYHYEKADIYVDGLMYAYQKKAGKETVDWVYEELINGNGIPFNDIHGAYSCIIKYGNSAIAFSDNSGMHCLYYSVDYISNSFLKMIEIEKNAEKGLNFDLDSLCEYITLGSIYFEKTFFTEIKALESSKIIIIRDGSISFSMKGIGDIDSDSKVSSISEFFERFAYSISDYSICQALTGGYDSRMVYACLSSKINDHVAITSNDMSNKDVKIASEVAKVNGDELEVIPIPKPQYNDSLITSFLLESDGIQPLDLESFIRLSTFMHTLSTRFSILLTGDGGVMHKDWEWTQDLPFYRKKNNNPKRFYHQRLAYHDVSRQLGDKTYNSYTGQEERFINELKKISKPMNTQSYDSWYYRVSDNRRMYYNHAANSGLTMYAPLFELDIVRYSYALPRFKRFFNNSMRDTMTKEKVQIARLKTNYGTTASNEAIYLVRDVFYQFAEYFRKAYRLLGRKFMNKNVLVSSHTGWSLEDDLRNSEIAGKAIDYAKREGLIKKDLVIKDLTYEVLTRIIHIYWLAEKKSNE